MEFTADFFNQLRLKSDPLADAVIEKMKQEQDDALMKLLFDQLTKNVDPDLSQLPPYITEYFETSSQLPPWADKAKIKSAQNFYLKYGPEISMILLCKSLPLCYTCARGAKVMAVTGRFSDTEDNFEKFTRRLLETSQFIINVMSPDSLNEGGNGIITTQKIRLIHAAIRYYIKKHTWDVNDLGEPINQEDQLGTLMSFSFGALEGLEQLGTTLTEDEKEAYIHTWNCIGYVLGIDESLLPKDYNEAKKISYFIIEKEQAYSDAGVMLNESAVRFMEHIIPGNFFDDIPERLMHFFLDEKSAELLKIKKPTDIASKLALKLSTLGEKTKDELLDNSFFARYVSKKFNKILLQGFLKYYNKGKDIHFYIPPSLKGAWDLNDEWNDVFSKELGNYRFSLQKK